MSAKTDAKDVPVVLIHGLWMTPLCWEHWIARYAQAGHPVFAPAWPGFNGEPAVLRAAALRDPCALGAPGVRQIVDHYERFISRLPASPILMGHSFGGLFVQMLLDRGLGCAGVAIAPAPARGVLRLPASTWRVALPALSNPWNLRRAIALTPEQFHYAFCNALSAAEAREVYERYAAPGPDRVLLQAGLANITPNAATTVDFANAYRAPLLMIAGGKDHVAPPVLVKAGFRQYADAKAETEYMEFPERTHYTLGEAGWEALADLALGWALTHAARHAAPADASADGAADAGVPGAGAPLPPMPAVPPAPPG